MPRFTCTCLNFFEDSDNIDAIETQWTEFAGCETCKAMLPKKEEPIEAELMINSNRNKNKF